MSRLDRYYIPPGVPARPPAPPPGPQGAGAGAGGAAPPLPRKGILLMPPPQLPALRMMKPPLPAPQTVFSQDINWSYQAKAKSVLSTTSASTTSGPPHSLPPEKIRPDRGFNRRPLPITANCYEEPFQYYAAGDPRLGNKRRLDSHNVSTAMSLPDSSPRLALQRILSLYEKGDHREAASFMRRISVTTFRSIVPQLPADVFIEAMPHSLPILEAIYERMYDITARSPRSEEAFSAANPSLRPEAVVWQLVKFFAGQQQHDEAGGIRWEFCGPFISSCKRLLAVLLAAEPRLRKVLSERRRSLIKAIEGLGQHGLIGTSDEQLVNLHNALRQEFVRVQKAYSEGIQKLEALNLANGGANGGGGHGGTHDATGPAPVAQSHQRQLSLKANEVQERLIKNKTVLNVVEPTLENTSLEILLGILQQRIELDKECLFQYTQIKKDSSNSNNEQQGSKGSIKKTSKRLHCDDNQSVAPIFMRYQRGCEQVSFFRRFNVLLSLNS